jgi:signal transduction histidine kinase
VAIEASAPAAAQQGVSVRTAGGDAEPLRVGADRELVARALQPILENAIRHARSSVAVRFERSDGDVLLHVEDDGDGIDGADTEAIFTPGASASGGAGLGLPLARRLARSAGGDVGVRERDNGAPVGAHLVLRLPAVA